MKFRLIRTCAALASAALFVGCGDDNPAVGDETSGSSGETSTTAATTSGDETSTTGSSSTTGQTDTGPTGPGTDTGTDTGSGSDSSTSGGSDECSLEDEPSCLDEQTLLECHEVDGVLREVEVACDEGSMCQVSRCVSAVQQEFIGQLAQYIDEVRAETAVAADVDWDQLLVDGTAAIIAGDDSPRTLFRAARAVQLQIPQGHQWLRFGPGLCGAPDGLSYSKQTFYGVCGRAHGDGVIVTAADDTNPLGLNPGDRVIASDAWGEGSAFLDNVAAEPLCSSLTPTSDQGRRQQAASDFFGVLNEGATITVLDPEGNERDVDVPARLADDPVGWCLNPIEGGYSTFEAALTIRPDGVAVIRVPHFGPSQTPFPNPLTEESYYQWVSDYVTRLQNVMATIPADAPIIWDARGNSGGASEVPLAIVAGMPGANRTQISEGYARITDSSPFAYATDPLSTFSFVIPEDDRLNHAAPTAVLVDGVTTSAADFFALGVKEYSSALLVGAPGTANYGYGGAGPSIITGTVAELAHRIDFVQSRDMDGNPLEGHVVTPDLEVEYDPADLAAGIDTVLEAAVAALLEAP